MLSSKTLKEIVSEARPIIERQLDDAEMIAGLRDVVANAGGDWSALKALIKAQIQDERDETGNGKRVKKILDKAGFSTDYASLLGWSNMNEKNFSAGEEFDPITGEFSDDSTVPEREQSRGNGQRDHQHVHSRQTDGAKHGGQDGVPAGADHASNAQRPSINDEPSPEAGPRAEASPAGTGAGTLADREGRFEGEAASVDLPPIPEIDPNEDRSEDQSLGGKTVGANTGGDHVTDHSSAATAGAGISAPAKKPLRPNCLRPENCGGYGSNHCFSCKKAAIADEVAA